MNGEETRFKIGDKAAEKWTEPEALKLANDLLMWLKEKDANIFFEDFLYLSCNEDDYVGKINKTLPAYLANKFSSFSNILEQCKEIEKVKLKKFGAFDKLNASIVKFLLSAEYGLSEKTRTELTVDKIEGITFSE